ncbi:MAG: hypothetical protein KDI36_17580 [Pseudomonadales bacterium]|nr:hypothetical protein [Pseudomonadales bacterium]
MRLRVKRALRLLLSSALLAAVPVAHGANAMSGTGQWYQVEVILFSQKSPDLSNEALPEPDQQYPDRMVAIAPTRSLDITPTNLMELEDLLSYQNLLPADGSQPEVETSSDDFLFESRSARFQPRIADVSPTGDEGENAGDGGGTSLRFDEEAIAALLSQQGPEAFREVADNDRLLNRYAGSIRRSSRYQLLTHTAWRQPVSGESTAYPVMIQSGARYGDEFELDGVITVHRSRYLHVNTDLWYTVFEPTLADAGSMPSQQVAALKEDWPEIFAAETSRDKFVPVEKYHLQHARRMRSARMHYIDHPRIGMLVRIDEFSVDETADAQAE